VNAAGVSIKVSNLNGYVLAGAADDVKEGLDVHFCATYDGVFRIAFPEPSVENVDASAASAVASA